MKSCNIVLALVLLCAASIAAGPLRVAWNDPDNPPGTVGAYRLYDHGTNILATIEAPSRSYTFTNLQAGSKILTVTAVGLADPSLESGPSNELEIYIPRGVVVFIATASPAQQVQPTTNEHNDFDDPQAPEPHAPPDESDPALPSGR